MSKPQKNVHRALGKEDVAKLLKVSREAVERFKIPLQPRKTISNEEEKEIEKIYLEIRGAYGLEIEEIVFHSNIHFAEKSLSEIPDLFVKNRRNYPGLKIPKTKLSNIRKWITACLNNSLEKDLCIRVLEMVDRVERSNCKFDFQELHTRADCMCACALAWLFNKLSYQRVRLEATQKNSTSDRGKNVPTQRASTKDAAEKDKEPPQPPPAPK